MKFGCQVGDVPLKATVESSSRVYSDEMQKVKSEQFTQTDLTRQPQNPSADTKPKHA